MDQRSLETADEVVSQGLDLLNGVKPSLLQMYEKAFQAEKEKLALPHFYEVQVEPTEEHLSKPCRYGEIYCITKEAVFLDIWRRQLLECAEKYMTYAGQRKAERLLNALERGGKGRLTFYRIGDTPFFERMPRPKHKFESDIVGYIALKDLGYVEWV